MARRQGAGLGSGRATGSSESDELEAFFAALARLQAGDLLALAAAWQAIPAAAREDAWTSLRAVAATAGRGPAVDAARQRALRWAERPGSIYGEGEGIRDSLRVDARHQTTQAVIDAAAAIAVGRGLPEMARDVLLGPWLSVAAGPGL